MTVADVAAVSRIEALSSPAPWHAPLFLGCLRPGYLCLVLEKEARVAGFIIANHAAGEGHVLNLAVDPACRRQGLASRALGRVISSLHRRFVTTIFLEVRRSNAAAIALYQAFGFTVIGMRQDYYVRGDGREDALAMQLALARDGRG